MVGNQQQFHVTMRQTEQVGSKKGARADVEALVRLEGNPGNVDRLAVEHMGTEPQRAGSIFCYNALPVPDEAVSFRGIGSSPPETRA
ncbi:hypothetical protein ColKHC_11263 [Colletotrichum higginsianum]|nr:hypothetical protein ColKHC_11263 [Colletotrichum higginsianum]